MGKTRMTLLDVKASVANLRAQILGARVANVYDIDPKTYLIKTAKGGEKVMLLLESGVRFHSTAFMRDKSNTPSGFSLKLRKHIRTKKVEEVRQLGVDRVVVLTFGVGDEAFHLILELFAGGNIILTDHTHTILALLRTHADEATGQKTAVREVYPLEGASPGARQNAAVSTQQLAEAVQQAASDPKATVKDALVRALDHGPALVEHALLGAGVDARLKAAAAGWAAGAPELAAVAASFAELDQIIEQLNDDGNVVAGYIVRRSADEESPYEDFSPILLRQFHGRAVVEFPSFDKAMDAYYTVAEDQKLEAQKAQQKKAALSKVERVRKAQEDSIRRLQEEEEANFARASLIEANLAVVDNAILVVNSLLAQGADWGALKKMVKEEARKGNPIASLIHGLKLDQNTVTLLLSESDFEALDEEAQTQPTAAVDIDLGLNAYGNAQFYYTSKKKMAHKVDKTVQAADKAIKGATRKAKEDLKRTEIKAEIKTIRKTHWFEKFIWFISSENFLVLAGRDAQQNELLVKRHMSKGDIYLHADTHGAATHIVKNHTAEPVPPLTLAQAGLSCVCRSAAWDVKMVTSAYWVHPEQVSKSAPTGEYLSTGSFMIRGKKNYLPPNSLVMGFGLLFRVDESCLAHHVGERRIRGHGDGDTDAGSVAGDPSELGDEPPLLSDDEEDGEGDDDEDEGAEGTGGGVGLAALPEDEAVEHKGAGEAGGGDDGTAAPRWGESNGGAGGASDTAAVAARGVGRAGASPATLPSPARSSGASAASAAPRAEPGAALRVDMDNVDRGERNTDGIRVGAPVSMAAFADDDDDDDDAAGGAGGAPRAKGEGKRHLSAAERKRLKKTGELTPGAGGSPAPPREGAGAGREEDRPAAPKGSGKPRPEKPKEAPPAAAAASQRGKNAKKKKMAKYAEQDEDEREAAMLMLGHKSARRARGGGGDEGEEEEEAAARAEEERRAAVARAAREAEAAPTGLSAEVEAALQALFAAGKCRRADLDAQTLAKLGEFADADAIDILARFAEAEILDKVKNKAAFLSGICHRYRDRKAKEEREEVRALKQEEGIVELSDKELEERVDLDGFTALPRADDVLHYALPVCAPYFALQSYKYKVKITPAAGKKGKVAKQAQQMFQKERDATPRERDLIRALTDHEMVMQMISNGRIVSAGASGGGRKK